MTTNIFTNPYTREEARQKGTVLVQATCPIYESEIRFFRFIRPGEGLITGIMGMMWKKLYNECNERNITNYSDLTAFEDFVVGCRLISAGEYAELQRYRAERAERGRGLPNGPASGSLPTTSTPNERSGASSTRDGGATDAPIIPNVQSGSRTKRGGKRKNQENEAASAAGVE